MNYIKSICKCFGFFQELDNYDNYELIDDEHKHYEPPKFESPLSKRLMENFDNSLEENEKLDIVIHIKNEL